MSTLNLTPHQTQPGVVLNSVLNRCPEGERGQSLLSLSRALTDHSLLPHFLSLNFKGTKAFVLCLGYLEVRETWSGTLTLIQVSSNILTVDSYHLALAYHSRQTQDSFLEAEILLQSLIQMDLRSMREEIWSCTLWVSRERARREA